MRRVQNTIVVLAMILTGCSSSTKWTRTTTGSFNRIDQYLQSEISAGHLKGVHGLVYHDGQIVYDKAFGLRDAVNHAAMTGDEIYFIQSMTKPIISVALMMLYEEGRFSLDDPIEKYLPEYKNMLVINNVHVGMKGGSHPAKNKITIAQLLSHTSGMSHGLTGATYDKEIRGVVTDTTNKNIEARVKTLAQLPLMYEPGTKWNYSFSTDVISRLIEVLSGINTSAFIQQRVLQPLGMTSTGYNLTEQQQKRLMIVYNFQPDSTLLRSEKQPSPSRNTMYAGVNGLFSTTHDYLKFAQMLLNGGELDGKRILKTETIELMRKDYTEGLTMHPGAESKFYKLAPGIVIDADSSTNLQPGYGFGLGFGILIDPARASNKGPAGEFFWNGANSTYFFINPKLKLIGIFMTQVGFFGNPFHFYFGDKMREATYTAVGVK